MTKNIPALLLFITFLLPFSLVAQFGPPQHYQSRSYNSYSDQQKLWMQRMYITFGLPVMNLELDSKLVIDRSSAQSYNSAGPSVDTSVYQNKNSSGSYGFSCGTFFPLAKFNDRQMLALDVSVGEYIYNFSMPPVYYSSVDVATGPATFYMTEIPIGLMYKSGGEVTLNPKNKLLFSIGGGLMPSISWGGYNSAGATTFKLRSYLSAEMGYYFGIAVKLRFNYYPGTFVMVNQSNYGLANEPNGYGTYNVIASGSGNYMISLVYLYESRHWKDNGF